MGKQQGVILLNFNDVVSYFGVMLMVLGALLTLLVFFWLRDWALRVYTKWRKASSEYAAFLGEDRWNVLLEVTKIVMFLVMLFPLFIIIEYMVNDNATDPAPGIFTQTMPLVFIVITVWYLFAIVLYGLYKKNREDKEREARGEHIVPVQRSVGRTWQVRFGEGGARAAARAQVISERGVDKLAEAIGRGYSWVASKLGHEPRG